MAEELFVERIDLGALGHVDCFPNEVEESSENSELTIDAEDEI